MGLGDWEGEMERRKALTARNEVPPSVARGPTQCCLLVRQSFLAEAFLTAPAELEDVRQLSLPSVSALFLPPPRSFPSLSYQILLRAAARGGPSILIKSSSPKRYSR